MDPVQPVTLEALYGSDHTGYGEIATRAVSNHAAIAISIGKYPKGYPALDPNEDGVLAASDGASTLLALVDGHNGFDAAAATLDTIRQDLPKVFGSATADPATALLTLVEAASRAVSGAIDAAPPDRKSSRTTLALALVTADRATMVGLGDSGMTVIRRRRVQQVRSAPFFLGPDTEVAKATVSNIRLGSGDVVLLGSDGLFDFLGAQWKAAVLGAVDRSDAMKTTNELASLAFAGGAGDNISVAVCSG